MILESDFDFRGERIHDFYIPDMRKGNEVIKEEYVRNRKALLADVKGIKELSLEDGKNIEAVVLTTVTLTGPKNSVEELSKDVGTKKIDVTDEKISAQSVNKSKSKGKARDVYISTDGLVTIAAQTQPMYLSLPT